MSLTLKELKERHDKAYQANQVTRERASNDLVFYWLTHWDDNILQESQLAYRGEFDILRKAGRGIMADLASNPIQVDFETVESEVEDAGDTMDGLYRTDNNKNTSIEAKKNAQQEAVVCGFGAWERFTKYETNRAGDDNQVVARKPIFEANNTVFYDPNGRLLDKSDAKFVSVLKAYSKEGYLDLVEDLTGEKREEIDTGSFKQPEQSYTFPWIGGEGEKVYVAEFYQKEKAKETIITLSNPFGQTTTVRESDLDEVMDDLLDSGYEITSEKTIEVDEITKYIASGAEILNGDEVDGERTGEVIAGQNLPIIPVYGEHAYIEGEEHWEGVTRLAKDPQRLHNFQMSYLADIVSRSPRTKPIFYQEQIAGFEHMYTENGADNNYPYLLQNRDAGGNPLPIGPVAVMPEQTVPVALIQSIALAKEAVNDVASPGLPQDIADPDVSGKAVLALQARLDMQSMHYQEHMKHAERYDGVVFSGMAVEVHDVPRQVKLTLPDGTRKTVQIMESVVDKETGKIVVLNDLRNVAFDVYSKIGASYSSQKDQTLDRIQQLLQGINPADPKYNILMLKYLKLMDGTDFDDVRDMANKELIMLGVKKPETPEEEQMLAEQQQQPEQPSADMVLAMAEDKKGQAQLMEAETRRFKVQSDAQNDQAGTEIDAFEAQTGRMDTQVNAQKAGADIDYKRVDTFGKKLENSLKVRELKSPEKMSNEELYQQISAG